MDLLSEVLEKEIDFSFIPVDLPEAHANAHSSFTFKENIKKLRFLIEKYPKICTNLTGQFSLFEKEHRTEIDGLPSDSKKVWISYKKEVKKLVK